MSESWNKIIYNILICIKTPKILYKWSWKKIMFLKMFNSKQMLYNSVYKFSRSWNRFVSKRTSRSCLKLILNRVVKRRIGQEKLWGIFYLLLNNWSNCYNHSILLSYLRGFLQDFIKLIEFRPKFEVNYKLYSFNE